jgi:hypothetical protein
LISPASNQTPYRKADGRRHGGLCPSWLPTAGGDVSP